jgi:hypothetical protein
MNAIREFLLWLVNGAGKPDELLFKNDRDATEFVRRVYNQNKQPTEALKALYSHYKLVQQNGIILKPAPKQDRDPPVRSQRRA